MTGVIPMRRLAHIALSVPVQTLMAVAVWLVWLILEVGTADMLAIHDSELAENVRDLARASFLAMVWLLAWLLVAWLAPSASVIRWRLHLWLVVMVLWVQTYLVDLALPLAWFAMGWPWRPAIGLCGELVVLWVLVILHMRAIVPGPWGLRTGWAWVMSLVVMLFSIALFSDADVASRTETLPFQHQSYPARWMRNTGVSTEAAIEALWSGSW